MPEKIDQINKLNKLIKALPLPKKGLYKLKDNINLDDYIVILQSKRENKTYTINALELGGSSTGIQSLTAGDNITVDDTDPQNPIISATGGGSPAGSDTQIQYNNAGAFGADSGFTRTSTGVTNISSTFGTGTFGYQIGDNLLGVGFKGSLNIYTNVAGDIGLSGLSNTIQPQIIDQLNFVDGNSVTQSLLKNQYDIEVNNGTESSSIGITAATFGIQSFLPSGEYGISQSAGVVTIGNLSGGNNTKITVDDVNEHITISNLPAYDDDTAAGVGGLTAGMVYMTTGSGSAPLNAAGILMIKQ